MKTIIPDAQLNPKQLAKRLKNRARRHERAAQKTYGARYLAVMAFLLSWRKGSKERRHLVRVITRVVSASKEERELCAKRLQLLNEKQKERQDAHKLEASGRLFAQASALVAAGGKLTRRLRRAWNLLQHSTKAVVNNAARPITA